MSSTSHVRQHNSLLAAPEKRLLIWIAERLPRRINSDHLSALGLLAMAGAGAAFCLAQSDPIAGASLVVVCLLLNWFGDSLDGTVARVRDQQRPRYGYYLDHVIDLSGTAMFFAGLAASGYMSLTVSTLVVAAFFLVSAETYLATHVRGVFTMAVAGIGPTELRILLAAGAVALVFRPDVHVMGMGPVRLWDLGGFIGAVGMTIAFIVSSTRNARALYLEETKSAYTGNGRYTVISTAAGEHASEGGRP